MLFKLVLLLEYLNTITKLQRNNWCTLLLFQYVTRSSKMQFKNNCKVDKRLDVALIANTKVKQLVVNNNKVSTKTYLFKPKYKSLQSAAEYVFCILSKPGAVL